MKQNLVALSHAIHPGVLARYLCQVLLILAALSAVPLIAAVFLGEYWFAARLAAVIAAVLLVAYPAQRLPAREQLQVNESLVIVSMAFILSPLLMLYPLRGAGLPLIDTLFEAVSAVTTTGLSTLPTLEQQPRIFLFTRAWMQWYGGLGIVVFSVALLMRNQMAARRLIPVNNENVVATARTYARRVLYVYLALSSAGVILLLSLTGDFFDALVYTMAAVSTGGFSPHDASLAAWPGWAPRFAVLSIALLGAIPLSLYFLAWQAGWRRIFTDVEVRTLLLLTSLTTALLGLSLHGAGGMGWSTSLAQALLHSLSAQTTAGFSSISIAGLHDASKLLLIISMFIGGGMGSTAGGIKLLRLLLLLRLLQLLLRRSTIPAHAIARVELQGRTVHTDDIQSALMLMLLFVAVVVLSWLVFVASGYPALDALFEVVSATATVGLSTGITAQELPSPLKMLLCVDMLLGRLEIVALLVLLYPRTWFGRRTQ
jgi:trk system potassium uptake protein TrkH